MTATVAHPAIAAPAPPKVRSSTNVVRGILIMVAAMLILPGLDAIAKSLTGVVGAGQIAWSRFLFQSILLAPSALILLSAISRRGAIGSLWLHAGRGILIALTTLLFFAAVQVMPLADSIAIFFVEPLLLTLLSAVLLKEKIGWRRVSAALVGFSGALLVIQPKFDDFGLTVVLPLFAALSFALYMVLTRLLASSCNPLLMQFLSGVFGVLAMSVALAAGTAADFAVLTFVWPPAEAWALLGLLGAIATVGHMMIVFALKFAPASVVAPFQYLEIIGATTLGYIFFSDFPNATTWAGIVVIVGSGLYVIYRERIIAREEAVETMRRNAKHSHALRERAARRREAQSVSHD